MERTAAAVSRWRRRSLAANAAYAAGLLFPDREYVQRHFPGASSTAAIRRYSGRLFDKARRHVQFWGARKGKEDDGALGLGRWALGVRRWALGVGADDRRPTTDDRRPPNAPRPTPNALPDAKSAALIALIASGQRARLPAVGNSMLPAIRPGDTLVVGHASPEALAVGDIIVWLADERLIAHRVVRLFEAAGERLFQTHGDARPRPDPAAPISRVIGRVEDVERPQPVPIRRRVSGLARVLGGPG
jgi:signal peptidase I